MGRMSRRDVLASTAALGATAVMGSHAVAQASRASKPNILFILADDLGYADLSCYGRADYTTPVLDRLAAEGVQLMQAYANSAICSATRTALIMGQYQYRHRFGLHEPTRGEREFGLTPGLPTMPTLMKRAGYKTSLIGKWHLGSPPAFGPLKCGYDTFYGIWGGGTDYFRHSPDDFLDESEFSSAVTVLRDQDEPTFERGYLTDLLADRAVRIIEDAADDDAPFFMSLHFTAPHWPWIGPDDEDVSRQLQQLRHRDGGSIAVYGEMVRAMDASIGRVLAALQAAKLDQDTIVVFTSDNGGERFADVWPFVGYKGELLEGGIRVPAMVRWPGRIAAGSTSQQVLTSMDWLPTLLAAAGGQQDPASPSDGENLMGQLTGTSDDFSRRLFWRYKANEQSAVRDGDWKYLQLGGREHLFNLAQDQRERANLMLREPEIFAALKAAYAEWDSQMLPYTELNYSSNVKQGWYPDRY